MGYELTFHYHERDESEGKYNTEETKTLTKNVGRRSAEVPLEQVAAVVMGQLARRDIWVVDVEIAEFAKRTVSFKETKSGIIIKNRKFNYDQVAGHLISEEDQPEPDMSMYAPQKHLMMPSMPQEHVMPPEQHFMTRDDEADMPPQIQPRQQQPRQIQPKRDPNMPLRHEVFRPGREDYGQLQREGIKLSMGKTYPVFREVVKQVAGGPYGSMDTVFYVVQDDSGQKIEVGSGFFEPVPRGLSFTGISGYNVRPPEGKLSYVDTAPISTGDPTLDAMMAAQDAALLRRG